MIKVKCGHKNGKGTARLFISPSSNSIRDSIELSKNKFEDISLAPFRNQTMEGLRRMPERQN